MGCPDPGMWGPEMEVEDPRQPLSYSPCPPQHGVPAFTVPQPDGPLAVLKERAEQVSVSLIGGAGEPLYPFGPEFAHLCSEGQLLVQRVLGAGLDGFWLVGKDGRADDIRKGLLAKVATAAPLTPL